MCGVFAMCVAFVSGIMRTFYVSVRRSVGNGIMVGYHERVLCRRSASGIMRTLCVVFAVVFAFGVRRSGLVVANMLW